jgi:hypothetical protein
VLVRDFSLLLLFDTPHWFGSSLGRERFELRYVGTLLCRIAISAASYSTRFQWECVWIVLIRVLEKI